MRIVFFGSGEFGIPCLRMLQHEGHALPLVITQPDRPAGRGRAPHPTPIRAFALELGLETVATPRVNEPDVAARVRAAGAELAVVIAFGQKIGRALIDMFPVGIVNLHGSLLPRWRGAAPIQWSIMSGDEQAGVSVFRIVEKMDAGPLLSHRRTQIKPAETAEELHDRLAAIGCDALKAAMERLVRDPRDPGDPQDESLVTVAPRLSKADGRLDFARPAIELERRINGLYSWPGARCRFVSQAGRQEEVILARALADAALAGPTPPSEVGVVTLRGGVMSGRGELAILEILPQNSRKMSWEDFVNGRHVRPGDRFESLGA